MYHDAVTAVTQPATALRSEFVFVLCQHGAERALKHELTMAHPELRAAYQRPGLVTFRGEERALDAPLRSVLARSWGLSLGNHPDTEQLAEALLELQLPVPLCLHVAERERFRDDAAPKDHHAGAVAARIDAALRARLPSLFRASTRAEPGELVIDVVVGESDEPLLLGAHLHTSDRERSPHPGGVYVYDVPEDAPSRAFRKIEECRLAFALPIRAGDVAVELGAAPGGAAYALLRQGVRVIGIDPAEMDPVVVSFTGPGGAQLTHVQLRMNAVDLQTLPREAQWLLLDVHLAPHVALREVSRFLAHYRRSLLGAVLTLKLNKWSFLDDLHRFKQEARALGLVDPIARQLPAHRQELALAGLTKLGHSRLL